MRILQGKETNLFQNFIQYGLPLPEMLRIDVSPRGRSALRLQGLQFFFLIFIRSVFCRVVDLTLVSFSKSENKRKKMDIDVDMGMAKTKLCAQYFYSALFVQARWTRFAVIHRTESVQELANRQRRSSNQWQHQLP